MIESVTHANDALLRLLVAGLLGGIIGLERERAHGDGAHFAGVRTFPIFALLGAGLTLAAGEVGTVVAAGFVAMAALVVVSYLRSSRDGDLGATTESAALATYAIGVLAGTGALLVAGAAGITVAILLASKQRLEGLTRALSREELEATLTLAALAAVILPVLPDTPLGPWGVWNPRALWAMVVLVCGLSFVAFVAMRIWGSTRGLYLSGLLGGLVSSTAATVSFAARSTEAVAHATAFAVATGLACLVMLVRIGILVAVVNRDLLVPLAPFLAASLAGGAIALAFIARRAPVAEAAGPRVTNPFRLAEALKFAALYGVVLLLVAAAGHWLGTWGVVVAAVVAGFTDVDAITLSLAGTAGAGLAPAQAALTIGVAALSNTAAKAAYAGWLGSPAFRRAVVLVLGAVFAGGAFALVALQ